MSYNLWCPFWINIFLLLSAIPIIKDIPDPQTPDTLTSVTTSRYDQRATTDDEAGPLLEDQSEDSTPTTANRYANAFETTPKNAVQTVTMAVRKLVHLVTGRRNFQVLLCSFFLTALASSDTKLLVQYISKRYEWTFAQVCNIFSSSPDQEETQGGVDQRRKKGETTISPETPKTLYIDSCVSSSI